MVENICTLYFSRLKKICVGLWHKIDKKVWGLWIYCDNIFQGSRNNCKSRTFLVIALFCFTSHFIAFVPKTVFSLLPLLSLHFMLCLSSLLSPSSCSCTLFFVLSPPLRDRVSVCLSGEERWVLPSQILFRTNSSAEKHVCHQRADAGLLLQFHKRSPCGDKWKSQNK